MMHNNRVKGALVAPYLSRSPNIFELSSTHRMRFFYFLSAAGWLSGLLSVYAELVDFTPCPSNTFGLVESVDISPCERGASDEPCRFRFGSDYTITSAYTEALSTSSSAFHAVQYTPLLSSGELPRANLQARDDFVQPSLRYPYSGQAFDGSPLSSDVWCMLTGRCQPASTLPVLSKADCLLPGLTPSRRYKA